LVLTRWPETETIFICDELMKLFSSHFGLGSLSCFLWIFVTTSSFGGDQPAPVTSNPVTVIPATAIIGSVQVGFTTMEQLEAMLGEGRHYTGGHPQEAREWRSKQNKGIKPAITNKNVLEWEEKGYERLLNRTDNHDELVYTAWTGKLTFRHNKLEDISVDCQ
jgi:hypothetical protein